MFDKKQIKVDKIKCVMCDNLAFDIAYNNEPLCPLHKFANSRIENEKKRN